ncbi:hypothetical protein COT29_00085 [Candidatus Micrarchaeota archaeon CG08_land_8_20_14_0_20_59_11]|nr:MAG: hypothetical protein COT29_00085 [Candidatus Micrarchaeota archaeon CG08_land_8_20_14_0_20_59_11]
MAVAVLFVGCIVEQTEQQTGTVQPESEDITPVNDGDINPDGLDSLDGFFDELNSLSSDEIVTP